MKDWLTGFDVRKLRIGDRTFEYYRGIAVECEVITTPQRDEKGIWTWKAKRVHCEGIVDYAISENLGGYIHLYHHLPDLAFRVE